MKKIKIGLLGLGTVGTGVYKLLRKRADIMEKTIGAELEIKKILVHNMNKKREGIDPALLTDDWHEIIGDDEIQIVVEVMGGMEPAKTIILEALKAGKNVVSANKDLIAEEGRILLDTAQEYGKDFLFEAAVAGGIPIIRALNSSMTADVIEEITGILNGTTNYMLTKMFYEGADYDEVLKEAQDKGYAERNPEADVEGYDACRKIAILSSLISGQQVDFEDIYTEGITKVSRKDMMYAKKMGMTIKLLASSKRHGNHLHAIVSPALLGKEHPLYNVDDVFNAVFVRGNVLGDAMFYGSGAGKLPTASAVVADVVDEVKHLHRNIMTMWKSEKLELLPIEDTSRRFFIRFRGTLQDKVENCFGPGKVVSVPELEDEFGYMTELMTEGEYLKKAEEFPEIIHMIRAED